MTEKKQCNKLLKGFKKKWVEALRSGKYKKVTGDLYDEGAYCVLGVAGKIAGYKDEQLQSESDLCWADDRVPALLRDGESDIVNDLIVKNDGNGYWSFKRLANYIEKNL